MIKRRSFLTFFGLGWLASCFPVVLAACDPSQASTQAPADGELGLAADDKDTTKKTSKKTPDGFTVVGSVAELDRAGFVGLKDVAVTRNPTNPKKLLAVNSKCTHQGCTVKWEKAEKKYECPCHDSDFAADGKVLKGPATKSLATYTAKIVGTQVLVKI